MRHLATCSLVSRARKENEMDTRLVIPAAGEEVEVLAKARRRRFTLEYKRRILREADRCRQPGEIGALLRREGLYSSQLSAWRAARERGELGGPGARKRGPEAKAPDPREEKIAEQAREIARWQKRAERAEALVEVQKKLSELLGVELPPSDGKS